MQPSLRIQQHNILYQTQTALDVKLLYICLGLIMIKPTSLQLIKINSFQGPTV